MNIIETKAYQKAFIRYLRRGTPISLSLKEGASNQAGRYYIWRTEGDEKVRPAHAINNGLIFSRENPPSTGNPGEDYNCRCWAEPIGSSDYTQQKLITSFSDQSPKWTDKDFFNHFVADGGAVTLRQTGYLGAIIDFYERQAIAADGQEGVYRRVNEQIKQEALARLCLHLD